MSTATTTKPKRRFLRFSLRTLLLSMLIVCIVLGTLGLKIKRARNQGEAVAWVLNLGGTALYDYEFNEDGREAFISHSPVPEWLRKSLGVDFFHAVVEVCISNNKQVNDVAPLARLTSLKLLYLKDTQVSDVTPLAGLMKLKWLYLHGTQVNDVTPLAGLTRLRELQLQGTAVADVTPLAGLTNLKLLDLRGTLVSDLTPLAGMTSLRSLNLCDLSNVSQDDYKMLKNALPKCTVRWSPTAGDGTQ